MIGAVIAALLPALFAALTGALTMPPANRSPANRSPATVPHGEPVLLAALAFTDTTPSAMGGASNAEVRMLFCSIGGVWRSTQVSPACQAPMPTSWNALHDGHVIGRVDLPRRTGAAATSRWSKPIRVRDVNAAMRIPVKGDRFERWSGPVVYRPLALVVDRNVRDPEQWQPIDFTAVNNGKVLARVRLAFRRSVQVPRCESVPGSRLGAAPITVDSLIRDRDLMVTAAFRSLSGAMLVGIMLDERTHPCDDVRDPSRTEQWFAIDAPRDTTNVVPKRASNTSPTIMPRLIGHEMHPIGVADFDGDGHAEWLFSLSSYNEDGYLLVTDHLRQQVTTTWPLH